MAKMISTLINLLVQLLRSMGALVEGCCQAEGKVKKPSKQASLTKKYSSPSFSTITHKAYNSTNKLCESTTKTYDSTNISSDKSLNTTPIKYNGCQLEEQQEREFMSLDNFIVKGLLGSGNFGSVYLVTFKGSEEVNAQKLALKKISKQGFTNKKIQQSTMLQKIVMAKMKDPFLTSLKFSFADDKFVYLAMEYAVGGSVDNLLSLKEMQDKKNMRPRKFKGLGEEGVRFIAGCVILGLQRLHESHIIYRDLKPQNLIIFEDGYVKLTDFGLAKMLENRDETKTQVGTVLYFAPQMVLKQGYSKQVDLWQLGILIYELAVSKSPFRKDQILMRSKFKDVVVEFQKSNRWKDVNLSVQLKDLIIKLLKFNPKDRLGCKGFDELKSHVFFKDLDWIGLSKKRLQSPLWQIIKDYPLRVKEVRRNDFRYYQWRKQVKSHPQWSYDYRSLN